MRQHRERRVIAHGEDRLLALGRHRSQDVGELFLRVAKGGLAGDQVGHDRVVRFPGVERLQVVLEPSTVRFLRCEASLDGVVFLEAAVLGIDAEHLSGTELPAADAAMTTDIDGASF